MRPLPLGTVSSSSVPSARTRQASLATIGPQPTAQPVSCVSTTNDAARPDEPSTVGPAQYGAAVAIEVVHGPCTGGQLSPTSRTRPSLRNPIGSAKSKLPWGTSSTLPSG